MFRTHLQRIFSFDARSLAAFRILLGIMIVVDLLDRATVFEVMYTERGLTPLADLREIYGRAVFNERHFSFHMLHGGAFFQGGMFVLAGLCACGLMVGWNTRFFVVASWVLHASVHTRNPVYGSAADLTLGLMLFWAMFLPLAGRWSLDWRRGKGTGARGVALVGGACYLIQVSIVYVCAALAKGSWWHDGTALLNILNYQITATGFGYGLTSYPVLLRVLTHFVFYLELFGPLLLWVPLHQSVMRGICVILFLGFHLGIAVTLDIGLFPFFSMVLWVPFVPAGFWQRVGIPSSTPVAAPKPEVGSHPVQETSGTLPGPAFGGKKFVSVVSVFIAVATLSMIIITTVPGFIGLGKLLGIAGTAKAWMSFTKLSQSWSVFANERNLSRDGWFLIEGTLHDGRKVDIMRGGAPADWKRPAISGGGKNRLSIIWLTYLANQERKGGSNLDRFAAYLNMKQKERSADGATGFEHIRMVFVEDPIPGKRPAPKRTEFWSGSPP